MRINTVLAPLLSLALGVSPAGGTADEACPPAEGMALQVLGSGGPIADDGRASSAYLVWIDGASRALIDAGGGAFLRFGEAGGSFEQLEFVGLSHFHTDHSADFPALLKSGYFSQRERPLPVAGPGPGGPFPGLNSFLHGLFGESTGAYRYLSGYLDGGGGLVELQPVEVPVSSGQSPNEPLFSTESFVIDAMAVPHGIVPSLAFRLRSGKGAIVFAGDQNGSDPAFADFARGAGLLVMHMAIPQDAGPTALKLHAPPRVIGRIAGAAGAQTLVLSHFMARSLRNLDRNVEIVERNFDGRVHIAQDLDCLVLAR